MVKGIRYFIFLTMVLLLAFAVPAFAALPPGCVDQSQTDHEWGFIVTGDLWMAQTFTAGDFDKPQLCNVELMLGGIGGPVNVQIREGSPTGTVLGNATINLKEWNLSLKGNKFSKVTNSLSELKARHVQIHLKENTFSAMVGKGSNRVNTLGAATTDWKDKWSALFGFYKASFPGIKLTPGNTYAIVVSAPDNICVMCATKKGDYAGGDAYYSMDSGNVWNQFKNLNGCPCKMNDFYFKTYVASLESYEDAQHNPVCQLFTSGKNTVYIGGSGLEANTPYIIEYYDGEGNKKATENKTSDGSGGISSSYLLTSKPDAKPGTWHAVVYKAGDGVPAPGYVADDPNIVLQDDFDVDMGAIPEFPAVISSIMVVGICAGIYSRIKKRKLSMAG